MPLEATPVGATAAPEPAVAIIPPAPPVSSKTKFQDEYDLVDPAEALLPSVPSAPAVVSESPPPVPPKPQHSRRVLQMAADFGIPQVEIDAASPDELDGIVYHINRQLLARQESTHRETPSSPAPASAAPAPPVDEIDWGEHDLDGTGTKIKVAERDVFGPVAHVLKAQAKQIKELREAIQGITQVTIARENETTADKLDRFFEGQGEVFGKGPGREMGDTPEYAKRMAVIMEARRLAGPQATKDQCIAKMNQASKNLFGERTPPPPAPEPVVRRELPPREPANGRFTKQENAWLEAGLVRPTHRANAEEPQGVQRAANVLRAKMEEAGMDAEGDGEAGRLEEEMFG